MMHFIYVEDMWPDEMTPELAGRLKVGIERWLIEHVGIERDTRDSESPGDWGWSLTGTHNRNNTCSLPIGIYFTRREDSTAFTLRFGSGRKKG